MSSRLSGAFAPVVTPFARDFSPDPARFLAHCRWLVSHDVGLAIFGTNSEGNSLTVAEKLDLMERLADGGLEPARMMPGTGCCAIGDTVDLTRRAVELGCAGVLMLPPFYYKDVSDDGLFRSYAEVIERVGSDALSIYLYHIPQVSRVPLSLPLLERLVTRYPQVVAGIKDSSGDWSNMAALLGQGWPDFRVFAGSERLLLRNLRAGGAGCISAMANVNPAAIAELCRAWRDPGAEGLQQRLDQLRDLFEGFPMIAALKAAIAHCRGDRAWRTVRPPLTPLPGATGEELVRGLARLGFSLPEAVR